MLLRDRKHADSAAIVYQTTAHLVLIGQSVVNDIFGIWEGMGCVQRRVSIHLRFHFVGLLLGFGLYIVIAICWDDDYLCYLHVDSGMFEMAFYALFCLLQSTELTDSIRIKDTTCIEDEGRYYGSYTGDEEPRNRFLQLQDVKYL